MVLWMALPLAADELVQIDPLSGMPETLQIESFFFPRPAECVGNLAHRCVPLPECPSF